jgi:hypothetical protein
MSSSSKWLGFIILCLVLFSCSKTSNTPPATPVNKCKIIGASEVSSTGIVLGTYTFTYNSDGKPSGSIFSGPYADTVSLRYSGDTIYRAVAAGINSSVDTITINGGGLILKDKEVVGSSVYITDYVYDASQELQTVSDLANVTHVYFTNGDQTLSTEGSFSDTLVYDLTKTAVTGNLDQFNQLLSLGAMYIKNKHLLVSESHGSTTQYQYTFTSEGNISTIKILSANNSSATITYTYDCN